MNSILDLLTEILHSEVMFFALVVLAIGFVGLVGMWLVREIRGPAPAKPADGDASLSGVYRGSAGTTRTMDSSPSGILGAINRSGGGTGRSTQPTTSIVSGSSQSPGFGATRDLEQ